MDRFLVVFILFVCYESIFCAPKTNITNIEVSKDNEELDGYFEKIMKFLSRDKDASKIDKFNLTSNGTNNRSRRQLSIYGAAPPSYNPPTSYNSPPPAPYGVSQSPSYGSPSPSSYGSPQPSSYGTPTQYSSGYSQMPSPYGQQPLISPIGIPPLGISPVPLPPIGYPPIGVPPPPAYGLGMDYPDITDGYTNDFLYDYYDWVCSDTSCQLCNILTSECCDPEVNVNCFLPDSCLNNPCLSGGTCIPTRTVDNQPDFICACHPGFTGKYCQLTNELFFPPPSPPASQSYGYPATYRPSYPQQQGYGPQPSYPQQQGYGPQPSYPQQQGYGPQPVYPQQPGYGQQLVFPQLPGFPQQPAYSQLAFPQLPGLPIQPSYPPKPAYPTQSGGGGSYQVVNNNKPTQPPIAPPSGPQSPPSQRLY